MGGNLVVWVDRVFELLFSKTNKNSSELTSMIFLFALASRRAFCSYFVADTLGG